MDCSSTPAAPPLDFTARYACHTCFLEISKGFCYPHGLLLSASWSMIRSLSGQAPWLHGHYSRFLATTGLSVPVQRFDTIRLAGSLLVRFSYHRCDRFPQFSIRARIKVTPPLCRTPSGQSAGFRQTLPEATSLPSFDVICLLSTRERWFTFIRLLDPHLVLLQHLFRNAHDQGS